MKTFRLLSAVYGWRKFLSGWGFLFAIAIGLTGISYSFGNVPAEGMLRWNCFLFVIVGGFGWLPAAELGIAGSKTEFLLLRLPGRASLLFFHTVRNLGIVALMVLALAAAAVHQLPVEPAGYGARFFGMVFGCYLLGGTLGLCEFAFRPVELFRWANVITLVGVMMVSDTRAFQQFDVRALPPIIVALVAIGTFAFMTAELKPRRAVPLPEFLGRFRGSLFNPVFSDSAQPVKAYLKRDFKWNLAIYGLLAFFFTLSMLRKGLDSHLSLLPWQEPTPLPYLMVGLVMGMAVRVPYYLTAEQSQFFYHRGVDLAVIHRLRFLTEMRLVLCVSTFAGLGIGLLVRPEIGLAYAGFFALWGSWTVLMMRRPHLVIGLICVFLVAPLSLASSWTQALHLGMAGVTALMGLAAWGDLRRFLNNPAALRDVYLTVSTPSDRAADSSPAA